MVHTTVNLPRPVLCCKPSVAIRPMLCCTNPLTRGQMQSTHFNGRPCKAAPPPYQQLRYLHGLAFTWKCSKKVSWEHCSFLTVERSCFLLFQENPLIAWMTKRENIFYWWCLPTTLGWRGIWCHTSWGSQHLKGCKIIYAAYSVGSNKQHCERYLTESECLSYWDHNWPAASSIIEYFVPTFP